MMSLRGEGSKAVDSVPGSLRESQARKRHITFNTSAF